MGALTATVPKPLLTVGGRPIIEHIVRALGAAGTAEVIIVTGYRGEQIHAYLGDGTPWGVRLTYRTQETQDGTARALLRTRDLIGDRPFVLSWGDVMVTPENYATLLAEYQRSPCAALLMVNDIDDPWRGAAVYVNGEWRVTRLVEKPARGSSTTRWNNAGISVFSPLILGYAERLAPSSRGEYELPQAIAAMLADGLIVRALPVRGFWSDLGTPADLASAEEAIGLSIAQPQANGG